MEDLAAVVGSALQKYYEEVAVKIHKCVDPLSDLAFWTKPYPYGNSIGHLLLHLTGNMQDRVGSRIAGSNYQRDRNREFTESEQKPKQDIVKAFDEAIEMVLTVMRQQSAQDWAAPYFAATGPSAPDRISIFIRVLAHCNHHLGQIIYLTKELEINPATQLKGN